MHNDTSSTLLQLLYDLIHSSHDRSVEQILYIGAEYVYQSLRHRYAMHCTATSDPVAQSHLQEAAEHRRRLGEGLLHRTRQQSMLEAIDLHIDDEQAFATAMMQAIVVNLVEDIGGAGGDRTK